MKLNNSKMDERGLQTITKNEDLRRSWVKFESSTKRIQTAPSASPTGPDSPHWRIAPEGICPAPTAFDGGGGGLCQPGHRAHLHRLRVRRPGDLFLPYAPLRWLWLALVPGAAAGLAGYRKGLLPKTQNGWSPK